MKRTLKLEGNYSSPLLIYFFQVSYCKLSFVENCITIPKAKLEKSSGTEKPPNFPDTSVWKRAGAGSWCWCVVKRCCVFWRGADASRAVRSTAVLQALRGAEAGVRAAEAGVRAAATLCHLAFASLRNPRRAEAAAGMPFPGGSPFRCQVCVARSSLGKVFLALCFLLCLTFLLASVRSGWTRGCGGAVFPLPLPFGHGAGSRWSTEADDWCHGWEQTAADLIITVSSPNLLEHYGNIYSPSHT